MAPTGTTVDVRRGNVRFVALFGARPGSMLAPSAARVARETLAQELRLIDREDDVQAALSEVATRLDLALRLTHPSGGPLARGCLTIVRLGRDEVVLAATRTGSAVVVDGDTDVVLATPKAAGRVCSALGGRLDAPPTVIRLGWARLPPLRATQRLVLATRDLSVLYSPAELVDSVGGLPLAAVHPHLMRIAETRGDHDMVLGVATPGEAPDHPPATTRPHPTDIDLEDDPDTIDTIDPLATHHGRVPFVLGRLDRWLIEARQRGQSRGPTITLLGPRSWRALEGTPSPPPPARAHPAGTAPDHGVSLAGLSPAARLGAVFGGILLAGAFALATWLVS